MPFLPPGDSRSNNCIVSTSPSHIPSLSMTLLGSLGTSGHLNGINSRPAKMRHSTLMHSISQVLQILLMCLPSSIAYPTSCPSVFPNATLSRELSPSPLPYYNH